MGLIIWHQELDTDAKLLNFRHCQVCWTGAVCPYTEVITTLDYFPRLFFSVLISLRAVQSRLNKNC